MWPASRVEAAGIVQTPRSVYESMTPEERSKAGWSGDDQRAIDAGADIAQVTNIHRGGLYVAGGKRYTYESTSRRGVTRGQPRPTPRQIFLDAAGDRDLAVSLLKRFGYIR
jgi:hypothetical protein